MHPLSPLIDIEPLELKIAKCLEGDYSIAPDATFAATIALILAVLACGVQYSDLRPSERKTTSRDFASRSFRALHLANYLVRPTAPCLQTLLLLGSFIRNDGDASASWALLGTTMRLAQSVGLHDANNMHNLSERDKRMRLQLWKTVLQHDSILSLCFDRPTSTSTTPISVFPDSTPAESLDYSHMMWEITRLCADNLTSRSRDIDPSQSHHSLRRIDSIVAQASPHLQARSACLSMQDLLEHYTMHLHMSFLISVICRPAFLNSDQNSHHDSMALDRRGRDALASTVRHFLSLHKLTTYAIRTWTTLHEALSSALLLELLHEPDKSAELTGIQKEFLEVVIPTLDGGSGSGANFSTPHTRTIAALRKIAQKEAPQALAAHVTTDSNTVAHSTSTLGNLDNFFDLSTSSFDAGTLDAFDSILWGKFNLHVPFYLQTCNSGMQIRIPLSMVNSGWISTVTLQTFDA